MIKTKFRFDFEANEWKRVAPMSIARDSPSHVVLSGRLYVIGGWMCDKSVEYYDPPTNKWQSVAPMIQGRGRPAVGALNGYIYVFGGRGSLDVLQSIERYDPAENSWTEVLITRDFLFLNERRLLMIVYDIFSTDALRPSCSKILALTWNNCC